MVSDPVMSDERLHLDGTVLCGPTYVQVYNEKESALGLTDGPEFVPGVRRLDLERIHIIEWWAYDDPDVPEPETLVIEYTLRGSGYLQHCRFTAHPEEMELVMEAARSVPEIAV